MIGVEKFEFWSQVFDRNISSGTAMVGSVG